MDKFGERLTEYRKNKGMTQDDFAYRMGVTSQAVSKWERGQSFPDVTLTKGICEILEVDANDLLGITFRNNITENGDEKERKILLNNMCADPLQLILGEALIPAVVEGLKTDYIAKKRVSMAYQAGILVPIIRIRDEADLEANEFRIYGYGKLLYEDKIKDVDDRCFERMIDSCFESTLNNYGYILNKQIVKILVDNVKQKYPGIAEGIIPDKVSYLYLKKVLIRLIEDKVNIKNLIKIIECLEEEAIENKETDFEKIMGVIETALS